MKKKNNVIIQRITDPKKVQNVIKSHGDIIKPKTKEIICKGLKEMSKDIWTNKQQNYLDDKFNAIDKRFEKLEKSNNQRFEKLENQVKQNADGIKRNAEAIQRNAKAIQNVANSVNQIIKILARNGMR